MVRRICVFSEDMASFFRGITPKYIILTGCLFTLLFAFFSNEVYHPDEHFQILEYAHMKLFGTPVPAELPWEYILMMRPGLQPMIAYGLGWLLDAGGIYSPYLLFSLLHVLSGALSIVSVLAFYRAVRGALSGPSEEKWLLLLSFFLWFMVYLHVRFSSETFSGNLLLLLVSVYLSYGQRERKRPFVWGAGMGLLAGAAFIRAIKWDSRCSDSGSGCWCSPGAGDCSPAWLWEEPRCWASACWSITGCTGPGPARRSIT